MSVYGRPVISASCQDRGIGKALIEPMSGFARENGCYELRWQVSHWNESAIRFYKSPEAEIDGMEQTVRCPCDPGPMASLCGDFV